MEAMTQASMSTTSVPVRRPGFGRRFAPGITSGTKAARESRNTALRVVADSRSVVAPVKSAVNCWRSSVPTAAAHSNWRGRADRGWRHRRKHLARRGGPWWREARAHRFDRWKSSGVGVTSAGTVASGCRRRLSLAVDTSWRSPPVRRRSCPEDVVDAGYLP